MGLLRRADLLFSEREHEHFERKVPLPRSALGVQTDEIKVDLCCGVLKATIPLKPRETEVVHVPIA
jgi:HSP20 family molecular chaperone IbpA